MPRRLPAGCFVLSLALTGACGSAGSSDVSSGGSATQAAGGTVNAGSDGVGMGARPSSAGSSNDEAVGGSASSVGASAGKASGGAPHESAGSPAGGSQNVAGALGTGGTAKGGGANAGGANAGGANAGGAAGAPVSSAKCPDPTWKLLWGDDFDGASGAAVDGSKWTYDSGPNWYNGELQDYTTGNTNASLDGNGNLVIEARAEAREGRQYTSARLKTDGKKSFTYGRIEARMKLPYGQGMWPAFWMLGGNSWPNTGEIDIMENLGREPSIAHGTMHGPGYSGAAGPTASFTLASGAKFSDDFHVFAIEWETSAIRWYVDGSLYSTKTPADIKGNSWVFDHPFFIILNLAVGGDWPGAPDGTTMFPQKLRIDYVHVCQK